MVAEREGREKPYTAATVSGWEQGSNEPALSTLSAIAAVVEMSKDETHDFLFGTARPPLRKTPVKRVSSTDEKKKRA